jgi:hypothetical protein
MIDEIRCGIQAGSQPGPSAEVSLGVRGHVV